LLDIGSLQQCCDWKNTGIEKGSYLIDDVECVKRVNTGIFASDKWDFLGIIAKGDRVYIDMDVIEAW
jgi:hypothetical protein